MTTYNTILAAILSLVCLTSQLSAQSAELEDLYARLADPETQDWQLVQAEIERLWELSGSASADFLLRRGLDAVDEGDFEAAIEHLTALTDHAPDFAMGWLARANAYANTGRYGPAISDLRQVLALNPRNYEALAGMGVMLDEMGDTEGALAAFEAAAAIHPHLPDLEAAIARLLAATEGTAL